MSPIRTISADRQAIQHSRCPSRRPFGELGIDWQAKAGSRPGFRYRKASRRITKPTKCWKLVYRRRVMYRGADASRSKGRQCVITIVGADHVKMINRACSVARAADMPERVEQHIVGGGVTPPRYVPLID